MKVTADYKRKFGKRQERRGRCCSHFNTSCCDTRDNSGGGESAFLGTKTQEYIDKGKVKNIEDDYT